MKLIFKKSIFVFLLFLNHNCLCSENVVNDNSIYSHSAYNNIQVKREKNYTSDQEHNPQHLKEDAHTIKIAIVIDVFRAFTTASYVLNENPTSYIITTKSEVISKLAFESYAPLLIGKPEKGAVLVYDIPNSPTRVMDCEIRGKNIFHRTEAGAKGILEAEEFDIILAAGFVNAEATIKYIEHFLNPQLQIIPMGHEAQFPSLEDDICAHYINERLKGRTFALEPYYLELRESSGKYFFGEDQWQYPSQDFERCLQLNSFNFAVEANVKGDYATLSRRDV